MAKRKFQSSIELLQSANFDAVTAGYLGLGAKSDGFYIKTSAGVEGKVWHSANDGAGSGLDADLLDGQHWTYVHSRGQNLLTNGSALLGNNTNFSAFTFDGAEAYFSSGSFKYVGQATQYTDEFMPVNPTQRYRLEMHAKSLNAVGKYYAMVVCFDVDGNSIQANNHMYKANTLTTLAQPLNNGDTVMYLTSAANWENAGGVSNTHLRSLIIWNWTNSFGYLYPPLTYSRRWTGNLWDEGSVDYVNNTITLKSAWSGGNIPAGTQVSNGSSGASYKYIALSNTTIPSTWTYYSGVMDGIDLSGTNVSGKFPPGTAKVKIGWLLNYQGSGETVWFTNVAFLLDDSANALLAKLLTVDGSGSTLDADTLDTYHAHKTTRTENYIPVRGLYGSLIYGNKPLSELTAGFNEALYPNVKFSSNGSVSIPNSPEAGNFNGMAFFFGGDSNEFGTQLATNASDSNFFLRKFWYGSFGSWSKLWHSGNFNPSNYQGQLNGTGYVKANGTTISYINETYPALVNGLIPTQYLPAFVDDVLEYANYSSLPATGETGKIYVTLDNNLTYRWSGSAYVEISSSLALGETSSTAYRGDRGKIAYDHSQILGGTGVHISDTERTNWNTSYSWGNHAGLYVLNSSYTANDVLAKLLTVDGTGSGLDADKLDGNEGSFYLDYNNLTNKPTSFPPATHNHDDRYFTETESDARFSPIGHDHDTRYYTESESDNRYPVLSNGLIPNSYLPSYVDDVIEVANNPSLPAQGETGKIYVTIDDNKTYRWSGSYYVEISASLALGETSSTAYRGDRGKIAYDHSQIAGGIGVHISDTERTNWNLAYSWGNHSGLYQPIDADLTAIAGLSTTGYLRRTGAGAWQLDASAGGDNYEGWNILVNTSLMGYIPSKNTATTYAGGLNFIAGSNISLTPASGTNNRLQITIDAGFNNNMVTLGSDVALNLSAWTDALTISLPSAGTYWVQAKLFVSITGNTTAFFRLAIGTTYYDYTVLPSEAPTGTGSGTNTTTLIALLSVSGASTLKVQYYTANAGITLKSSMSIGGVTATGLTKLGYLKIY